MDEIKKINKQIRSLIIEIVFASFICGLAISTFINPNTTLAKIAFSNSSETITLEQVKPLKLENIFPVDDKTAIDTYDKAIIRLTNNSNNKSTYKLIYRVNNNSTLDAKWLKFMLNVDETNKIEFLSELEISKDSKYTDYILHTGEIDANSKKDVEYIMWLDKNVGNEAQNKSLSANLIVKSYGTELSLR